MLVPLTTVLVLSRVSIAFRRARSSGGASGARNRLIRLHSDGRSAKGRSQGISQEGKEEGGNARLDVFYEGRVAPTLGEIVAASSAVRPRHATATAPVFDPPTLTVARVTDQQVDSRLVTASLQPCRHSTTTRCAALLPFEASERSEHHRNTQTL